MHESCKSTAIRCCWKSPPLTHSDNNNKVYLTFQAHLLSLWLCTTFAGRPAAEHLWQNMACWVWETAEGNWRTRGIRRLKKNIFTTTTSNPNHRQNSSPSQQPYLISWVYHDWRSNGLFLCIHTICDTIRVPPASPALWPKIEKNICKYWATHSSVRSFTRTTHSFACSVLFALLTHFAVLSHARALGKVND